MVGVGEIVEPAKTPLLRCGSVFSWGKTLCNGSRLVPNQTRNRAADMDLLLTLANMDVKESGRKGVGDGQCVGNEEE